MYTGLRTVVANGQQSTAVNEQLETDERWAIYLETVTAHSVPKRRHEILRLAATRPLLSLLYWLYFYFVEQYSFIYIYNEHVHG